MTPEIARYRKLNKYKYQLVSEFAIAIELKPVEDIETPFVKLTKDGFLTITVHYAWDGATRCPDFASLMRGALVHDALYQLMRLGKLEYRTDRLSADRIFWKFCLADGMNRLLARIVFLAVRWLGKSAAKPRAIMENQVSVAPLGSCT